MRKSNFFIFCFLIGLLALSGCKKYDDPIACFTYELNRGYKVQFINCSSELYTSHWSFGDGAESDLLSPEHLYEKAGSYTVVLTVTDPKEKKEVKVESKVEVSDFSEAKACFSAPDGIQGAGEPIQLLNCSQGALSYLWLFGDGDSSTEINANHIYSAAGKYMVQLTATSADGLSKSDTSVEIRIGDKYITAIRLLSFPTKKSDGSDWDFTIPFPLPVDGIGPEPDIKISINTPSLGSSETAIVYDLATTALPYEWDLAKARKLIDEEWTINLIDDDGFLGTEDMKQTYKGNFFSKGKNGQIALNFAKTQLLLTYDIR